MWQEMHVSDVEWAFVHTMAPRQRDENAEMGQTQRGKTRMKTSGEKPRSNLPHYTQISDITVRVIAREDCI